MLKLFIIDGVHNQKSLATSILDSELLENRDCLSPLFIPSSVIQCLVKTRNCLLTLCETTAPSIVYAIYLCNPVRKVGIMPILQVRQMRHRGTE